MVLVAFAGLVSVSFAPCALPTALERLSAAMGERLECVPALRDEVFVARLEGADRERVLREVATCLDARWEKGDGRLVLKPDPAVAARREALARRERAGVVARDLGLLSKELARLPRFDKAAAGRLRAEQAAWEKIREKAVAADDGADYPRWNDVASTHAPGWRAGARLVVLLGAGTLGSMVEGERAVWAEGPTAMQRAFPLAAQSALAAFRREQALLDPQKAIFRVRLAVTMGGTGVFEAALEVLDRRGAAIFSGKIEPPDEEEEEAAGDESPEPSPARPAEKPLEAPAETAEYLALLVSRARPIRDDLFEKWRPRLADPATYEPTSWYPGMALVAAAQAQGRNLLGSIPDYSGVRFGNDVAISTPEALLRTLESEEICTVKDGWIVVKPTYDLKRVSRGSARALFARAIAQGGLDVDAAAEWIGAYPLSYPGITWVGTHLSALLPNVGATLDEEVVGLWGAMGAGSRAALRRGATIPLLDLPSAARKNLLEGIYWAEDMGDMEGEVTEALPNGIVNGTVGLTISEEPVAVAWSEAKGEPVYRNAMTSTSLGNQLARSERRSANLGYNRYRLGKTRRYRLVFSFVPERVSFSREMSETFFDPQGAAVERLPEEFRRKADEARLKTLADPNLLPPPPAVRPR